MKLAEKHTLVIAPRANFSIITCPKCGAMVHFMGESYLHEKCRLTFTAAAIQQWQKPSAIMAEMKQAA